MELLTSSEATLLEVLSPEPLHVDELASGAGISPAETLENSTSSSFRLISMSVPTSYAMGGSLCRLLTGGALKARLGRLLPTM